MSFPVLTRHNASVLTLGHSAFEKWQQRHKNYGNRSIISDFVLTTQPSAT